MLHLGPKTIFGPRPFCYPAAGYHGAELTCFEKIPSCLYYYWDFSRSFTASVHGNGSVYRVFRLLPMCHVGPSCRCIGLDMKKANSEIITKLCTAWCSETCGSLWSLDAPELHASVHQAVLHGLLAGIYVWLVQI